MGIRPPASTSPPPPRRRNTPNDQDTERPAIKTLQSPGEGEGGNTTPSEAHRPPGHPSSTAKRSRTPAETPRPNLQVRRSRFRSQPLR